MLEQIFDTKIKIKILKVFFNNSNKAFQTLDIANFAKISSSRASECLNHLVNIGILSSQKIGKGYLFRINQSNYFVKIIFYAFKKEKKFADTIVKEFVSLIKKEKSIKSIALFGSAIRELKFGSDIDILVVYDGKIDEFFVQQAASELTQNYSIMVSVLLMSARELKSKAKHGEGFMINVLANNKLIYGNDLEDIVYGSFVKKR